MPIRKPATQIEWLILLAALSFVPTLFYYLVGEEGTYVITSMEMWQRNNWLQELHYGGDNGRPPLVNWLTMSVASLIGWSHIVIAIRLVSVAATLGMAAWLYWLSMRLFADKPFATFAVLAFLTLADLLLYRGWVSYTDPVFAFFTFGAMASLWIASIRQRHSLLALSVLLASCAMLSKAFTVYVFCGTVGFVLLWRQETRRFLLSPKSLSIFALLPVIPLAWMASVARERSHGAGMLAEIIDKLSIKDWSNYLQHLVEFPAEALLHFSPAVLLALYLLMRKRVVWDETTSGHFRVLIWIAGLGFLPYWLSPQSGIRYLLPLYPMIALASAYVIWNCGESARRVALRWFGGIIGIKLALSVVVFPYYQEHYRGKNYRMAAEDIIARTQDFPIYVQTPSSHGLSVAAYIDLIRYPTPVLTWATATHDNCYVLVEPEFLNQDDSIIREYAFQGNKLYLLCRGAACSGLAPNQAHHP